eukprot:PITA_33492
MLQVATTCKLLKTKPKSHATGIYISSSLRQKSLSTNAMTCNIEPESALFPGLPDDVAKHCLALVPRIYFQFLGSVCKLWRKFIQRKEFYVVLSSVHGKWQSLPPMPGPMKTGFSYVVIDRKLLVMAGLFDDDSGTAKASANIYMYESALNRWSELPNMKVARYDFACAEVNGLVYVVGGHGERAENLSSVEVFDPKTNEWTMIESLRRPRWGCFAHCLEGRLYVMGGRSSFTIGHPRCIDVYDPKIHTWKEMKNGCFMVVAHAVLDKNLFCIEWKNERKLAVFNIVDNSWQRIPLPLTGSITVGFRFGILNGNLLFFSTKIEPLFKTLVYDPMSTIIEEDD